MIEELKCLYVHDFLEQEMQSSSMPVRDATPEDLIRSTKDVTLATAKAVAAGNSCHQDDIITAANMGRKAVTEMLIICKVGTLRIETERLPGDLSRIAS